MTGIPGVDVAVRGVLQHAAQVYRDDAATAAWLREQLRRMDEPLRVAIAGKVKAGKSTLLNALVGEEIAPTDAGECTRVVTWYRDALSPALQLQLLDGERRSLPVHRQAGRLQLDLGAARPEQVDRLLVDWPSRSLRTTTLIDTPGIASLSAATSARTTHFLAPDEEPTQADAVVYLMRHLHASDVHFLESFHDRASGGPSRVNTLAVLSRADEVGVGRLDAMLSAQKVSARYRVDPKLRALCQTVVPVAGLLAQSGRTLREDEFAALAELARLPDRQLDRMLLSVDRFTRDDPEVPVPAGVRHDLLERFGVFGVRLATSLVRHGRHDATSLSGQLVRRSGLDQLRAALATHFTDRRHLLKARVGLLGLDRLLRTRPRAEAAVLAGEVERILAGAHEFREVRLLAALRTPLLSLPRDAVKEAERLLGGGGAEPVERLGAEPGEGVAELRERAAEALRRWHARAASPVTDRATADACRVVIRSCEGLLARLPRG